MARVRQRALRAGARARTPRSSREECAPRRACRSVSASCVSPQMRIHQRSPPFPPSSQNRVVTASPLPSSVRRWIVDLGESCVSPALLHGARWGFPARDGRWLAAPSLAPAPAPAPARPGARRKRAPGRRPPHLPPRAHPRAAPSRRRRAAHAHSDPPRPRISRGSPTGGRRRRRSSSRWSPHASPAAAAGETRRAVRGFGFGRDARVRVQRRRGPVASLGTSRRGEAPNVRAGVFVVVRGARPRRRASARDRVRGDGDPGADERSAGGNRRTFGGARRRSGESGESGEWFGWVGRDASRRFFRRGRGRRVRATGFGEVSRRRRRVCRDGGVHRGRRGIRAAAVRRDRSARTRGREIVPRRVRAHARARSRERSRGARAGPATDGVGG